MGGGKLITDTFAEDNIELGTSTSNNYQVVTIDVSKDGYTPIGIVGFRVANATDSGSMASQTSVFRASLSNTTATISVRNESSSSTAKVRTSVVILFEKD